MTEQKNVNLYEAYASIYAPQEEVGQLDEAREASHDPEGYEEKERKSQSSRQRRMNDPHTGINSPAFQAFMAQQMGGGKKKKKPANEEVEIDLFDTILEYLVSEGYADTNESALVIMANMSEEWRQSIVEGEEDYKPLPRRKMLNKANKLRKSGDVNKKAKSADIEYQLRAHSPEASKTSSYVNRAYGRGSDG